MWKITNRRSRKTRRPEVERTPRRSPTEGIRREPEEGTRPSADPSKGAQSTTTGALTIITATSMNGLEEVAEEWEETEFMADSGA